MRIDLWVVLLPGGVLVKVRVKDKKKGENWLDFLCVKKYKARDLVFINFKYIKNL